QRRAVSRLWIDGLDAGHRGVGQQHRHEGALGDGPLRGLAHPRIVALGEDHPHRRTLRHVTAPREGVHRAGPTAAVAADTASSRIRASTPSIITSWYLARAGIPTARALACGMWPSSSSPWIMHLGLNRSHSTHTWRLLALLRLPT